MQNRSFLEGSSQQAKLNGMLIKFKLGEEDETCGVHLNKFPFTYKYNVLVWLVCISCSFCPINNSAKFENAKYLTE